MIDTNADMRFMSNNFLVTGYNSLEVSSVAQGFYSDDLTTEERSRVMRFGGRFTIDATNNKIYINSTTYTLTNGEYLTPALLAAHISTIITASGVACTYSASGSKFIFSKASTFTVNLATLTNAAWETIGLISGVDQVSTLDSGTYYVNADMPRFHYPNEKIKVNFGYQASIGFIGIIGDLSRELRIPEGAVVTFKANNVDDFTAPPVNKVLTWTNKGLFGFIDDVADSAWQYVELTIEAPEGPFQSEIGYLYIGDYSSFVDRNISVGIDIGYVDPSTTSQSDDGQEYTNEKTPFRTISGMAVGLAKPVNVTFLKRVFALKQKSHPFFVALDPKVEITSSIDDLTMFCKFATEINAKHVINNFYELGFQLRESL
jgi:hypothetical protein